MTEVLDIRQKGGPRNGERQVLDKQLFMQFLAWGGAKDRAALAKALAASKLEAVLYEDLNDPEGVGLLTWNENPGHFLDIAKTLLKTDAFRSLIFKPEYVMLGRTYALGHEADLEDWLIRRPARSVVDPAWPWAVWYPLRRKGEFAALAPEEQTAILREHGKIGHSFGEADLAKDVRLASFGLDKNDNDFVIGLIGRELHPLSVCVETMRKTRQTSRYIQRMGPFFIGKALWRSPSAA
ncbi:MAG: chlorite dismutase family protein [Elusimicrobia bacterium]|nr:chlorite dismutase family protein [Elusimicrobiota bacterium]